MGIYNIACTEKECDYSELEILCTYSKLEEKTAKSCPKCGGKLDQAIPDKMNFILKGSGWTVHGCGGGNDWRSKLDKELTINDQLSQRNDEGFCKAEEKVKRAEDKANKLSNLKEG